MCVDIRIHRPCAGQSPFRCIPRIVTSLGREQMQRLDKLNSIQAETGNLSV